MPNYASKLGEAVGNAVEKEVQRIVKETVAPFGLYVDAGGARPGKRKGQKLLMVNDTGTEYQIDLAVENQEGKPFILLESKYIRYKKHNRDKASWTCVAHYKLRTTYPTVKKSIAVLMGQWSEPSRKLMNSLRRVLCQEVWKRSRGNRLSSSTHARCRQRSRATAIVASFHLSVHQCSSVSN